MVQFLYRGHAMVVATTTKTTRAYLAVKTFSKVLSHLFFFFFLFRATPMAHGGSQARGRIRAVAAGLRHSHSNARLEPCLQTTPHLTAMLDP